MPRILKYKSNNKAVPYFENNPKKGQLLVWAEKHGVADVKEVIVTQEEFDQEVINNLKEQRLANTALRESIKLKLQPMLTKEEAEYLTKHLKI